MLPLASSSSKSSRVGRSELRPVVVAALGAVLNAFPAADRQHLRQLVRGFDPTGPRAREQGRKLFRYLRELQEESDPGS